MSIPAPLQLLKDAQTIAVVGASPKDGRPANFVPAFLKARGYTILPVNAFYAGQPLFEQPATATLAELDVPVDIVDVFRRSAAVSEHVDDILAMRPLPKVVWLQKGVINASAAATLRAAGITVLMNRCPKAELERAERGDTRVNG